MVQEEWLSLNPSKQCVQDGVLNLSVWDHIHMLQLGHLVMTMIY